MTLFVVSLISRYLPMTVSAYYLCPSYFHFSLALPSCCSKVQMNDTEGNGDLLPSSVSKTNIPFSAGMGEDDTLDEEDIAGDRERGAI